MNSPFQLIDLMNNDWAISWPTFDEKFTKHMRFNLLECIFKEIKCQEVGLGVSLGERDDTSIMWVRDDIWYSKITEEYSHYLYNNYNIRGVVFHKETEARLFKDILEKRYAWQLLKE
jgi:hypothetical protein